jgi:hypothetical protein
MKAKPKPVRKVGNRNIYCPHYDKCLDHAVDRRWKCWSCSGCPHEVTRQLTQSEIPTVHDPDVYYHVPSQIFRDLTYRLG